MCKKRRISLSLDKDIIDNLTSKANKDGRTVSGQVNFELRGKYSNWDNGGVQDG